jgi:hypothetical protein
MMDNIRIYDLACCLYKASVLSAVAEADRKAIRLIETAHKTRVITMIHRQEKRSLFAMNVARHMDLGNAQSIIAAIKETPNDMPIDLPRTLGRT